MKSLSHVQLFSTAWTAAYQAPPSMGFSRQEYWSGVALPSPSEWVRENIKKENKSPSFYPRFSLLKIWWTNSEEPKLFCQDFPAGPVVMSPACNTGKMGSIPVWATKLPHAAGKPNPWAATRVHVPQLRPNTVFIYTHIYINIFFFNLGEKIYSVQNRMLRNYCLR